MIIQYLSCLSLLQAYSCERWRSSESKRLNTSEWATTWPPSCPGASRWSTPTPRTSPSSTKETGWSDGRQRDGGKNKIKAAVAGEDKLVQVHPPPEALHPTPRHQSPHHSGRRGTSLLPQLPPPPIEVFYLVISLVSSWIVLGGQSPHRPLVRLLVFQQRFFLHSFISALQDLFSAGFLLMKSPMFTIVIHDFLFFWRTTCFYFLSVHRYKKKMEKKNEGKFSGTVLSPGGWTRHWMTSVLASLIYLFPAETFAVWIGQ